MCREDSGDGEKEAEGRLVGSGGMIREVVGIIEPGGFFI